MSHRASRLPRSGWVDPVRRICDTGARSLILLALFLPFDLRYHPLFHHRLIAVTNLSILVFAVAALAVMTLSGNVQVWHVYLTAFFTGLDGSTRRGHAALPLLAADGCPRGDIQASRAPASPTSDLSARPACSSDPGDVVVTRSFIKDNRFLVFVVVNFQYSGIESGGGGLVCQGSIEAWRQYRCV